MKAFIPYLLSMLVLIVPAAAETTIAVGTAGDYKPVTWVDPETGRFSGEAIDIVRAYAEDRGYRVEFVQTTWPTLMEDLLAGKFQIAAGGITKTNARTDKALASATIRTTGKVALVRCGDRAKYGSLEENRSTWRHGRRESGWNQREVRPGADSQCHFDRCPR